LALQESLLHQERTETEQQTYIAATDLASRDRDLSVSYHEFRATIFFGDGGGGDGHQEKVWQESQQDGAGDGALGRWSSSGWQQTSAQSSQQCRTALIVD
jgi:hypothetical protein